jgi:hypothetical protein
VRGTRRRAGPARGRGRLLYEQSNEPILTRSQFALRLLRHFALAAGVIALSLFLGSAGYHWSEHLGWLDAVLNAAMILSGMGPLHSPVTVGGKLFATAYALYSGVVFLALTAVMLAPVIHRVVHRFHLGDDARDD